MHGPQFNTAELDVLSAFENIFDTVLVQLIVNKTNRYAQQEISKSVKPFSGQNVHLHLFMMMGTVQKPTLRSYYAKNQLLFTPFFLRLHIWKNFPDRRMQNEHQGPPELFKIHPVIQHLNNKFQNLYIPNQNIATDESLTLWKGPSSFRQGCQIWYRNI
jgi:hypothetical protein